MSLELVNNHQNTHKKKYRDLNMSNEQSQDKQALLEKFKEVLNKPKVPSLGKGRLRPFRDLLDE